MAKDFGGPDVLVLGEVPDPVPGGGQTVVDVAVSDVGFLDVQLRQGAHSDYFTVEPPYIPGGGIAGTVSEVGDGVDPGLVGRRVVASIGPSGGYAARALVPADRLVPVPSGLDLPEAAALVHDGTTALALAELAGIKPEEWVLVTPAGGGLGFLLVQLATAAGARVVGAAGRKRTLDLAAEYADAVVDYSRPDWTSHVLEATGGTPPDVVFDGVGGDVGRSAFALVADGGRFSRHGAPSGAFVQVDPAEASRRGITVTGIGDIKRVITGEPVTARALASAVDGRLRPFIGQTYSAERAADAHAAIEAREAVGKTLLLW